MLPAHAGMVLEITSYEGGMDSAPRARGDGPFSHDLSEADQLMVEERFQAVLAQPGVEMAAVNNDEGAFRHAFEPAMKETVMERYESGVGFTERYFGEQDFQSSINRAMSRAAYRLLRQRNGLSAA